MSARPIQLAALTDKNIDFSNLDKGDLCSSESTTAAVLLLLVFFICALVLGTMKYIFRSTYFFSYKIV